MNEKFKNLCLLRRSEMRAHARAFRSLSSHDRRRTQEGGYVVILSTLFFIVIATIIIIGLMRPIVAAHETATGYEKSTQAFLVGSSAVDDAIYRLENNKNLGASDTLTLESGQATVAVADTFDGKQITVNSDAGDYDRSLQVSIKQSTGVDFNYGIQTGLGGFNMSGGAGVYGNLYSNGNVIGSGGPFVTGSVVVANASDPEADQSNGSTFPPPYSIDFGGNTTAQDAAQSFMVSTSTAVTSIRAYLKKSANVWMNNVTVRIVSDDAGEPGKSTLASATLSASQVTTSYNYLSIPFSNTVSLTPGVTYWLVFDAPTTWGSYYSLAASLDTYDSGKAMLGTWSSKNGGSWNDTTPDGFDGYFDIYVGGETGLISGITIGSGSTGDAWAHEVDNSTVAGTIYCQAATGDNKACDTSRPDPVQEPMPVSDGNIAEWKSEAQAGGIITGDQKFSNGTTMLGPKEIDGSLTVSNGGILELTGTVYVTGTITVNGAGVIRLADSYGAGSGILVTDGTVSLGGGGQVEGSGTTGSYILLVTTSACPTGCGSTPAMSISGGAGSVILNAQKGTINFSGGAQANQATANEIDMSGGTTIHYDTGISNMNFTSGPSGGWSISGWQEI